MKKANDKKAKTTYIVLNAKGKYLGEFATEKEAKQKMAQGLARGWKWTIKPLIREYHGYNEWEYAGCKGDPTKIKWGNPFTD